MFFSFSARNEGARARADLGEEVQEIETQCEDLEREIVEAQKTEESCNKKLKEIEYKIKHAKELKEKELKVCVTRVKGPC